MTFSTAFVDGLITKYGRGSEATIPILQHIQTEYRYLPTEALQYVCEHTEITPTQISGVASFFAQFRLKPVGKHVIKVCHGTACHVGGAGGLTESLEEHLKVKAGENTADGTFTLDQVACLGCCSLAPVIMVDETTYAKLDRNKVVESVEEFRKQHA